MVFGLHTDRTHDAATDGIDEKLNMSLFVRKYSRWLVLALLLVLTGSANLLCLSVDNDDDDDTAPVSIEFSFVVPAVVPCLVEQLEIAARRPQL